MTFNVHNPRRSPLSWWGAALTLAAASLLCSSSLAQPAAKNTSPFETAQLRPLTGFLGNWEINAKWSDGTPLWSRSEFTVGLGRRFLVARTFTKNGEGQLYQRYLTYFGIDKETQHLVSHGFTFDGTMAVVDPVEMGGEPGHESLTSEWSNAGTTVKQTVQLTSANAYSWKVWIRTGEDPWQQIMDGVWIRVD